MSALDRLSSSSNQNVQRKVNMSIRLQLISNIVVLSGIIGTIFGIGTANIVKDWRVIVAISVPGVVLLLACNGIPILYRRKLGFVEGEPGNSPQSINLRVRSATVQHCLVGNSLIRTHFLTFTSVDGKETREFCENILPLSNQDRSITYQLTNTDQNEKQIITKYVSNDNKVVAVQYLGEVDITVLDLEFFTRQPNIDLEHSYRICKENMIQIEDHQVESENVHPKRVLSDENV